MKNTIIKITNSFYNLFRFPYNPLLEVLLLNISSYHQWVITGPTQKDYPGTNLKGGGLQFTSLAILVV